MSTKQNQRMWLVNDEVMDMSSRRGVQHLYRFRMWRAKGIASVIMEPASPDAPPPDIYSVRAANLLSRIWLGSASGSVHLAWYENSVQGCYFVAFKRAGHALRLTMYKPVYMPVQYSALASRLGFGSAAHIDQGHMHGEATGDENMLESLEQQIIDFDDFSL